MSQQEHIRNITSRSRNKQSKPYKRQGICKAQESARKDEETKLNIGERNAETENQGTSPANK